MNLVDEIPAGLKSNQSLISDSVPSRSRGSKSVVYIYLLGTGMTQLSHPFFFPVNSLANIYRICFVTIGNFH